MTGVKLSFGCACDTLSKPCLSWLSLPLAGKDACGTGTIKGYHAAMNCDNRRIRNGCWEELCNIQKMIQGENILSDDMNEWEQKEKIQSALLGLLETQA